MILLRSLIFQLGVWAFTIPFTILSILTFPLSAIARYKFISLWAKTILLWLKISCNINFKVNGLENIPKKPFMVLSKHQSAWETLAFQKIFPPQVWVLKRELLWIPFFGWGLAMTSPIAINRKAGKKALGQMLKQGVDRISKGFCIIIFPEGTRIKPKEIGKYHIGGAWLAKKAKINIIPVAHNAGSFWPKNSLIKYPGEITVSIGLAIDTSNISSGEANKIAKDWIESEMVKINV
ncbi:1-acyl-sn-glycerol-3-phosphate acyltransferase [Methylophilaceae bacterium]|nr:1-acyl-sn-glycerol-3-phosphate acyltransferase [Methylophilaceae bacterium]|tara:strand:+ start:1164 stop:1871 length:708 start_codon:yes stop_codon:yes gene_type:complete